MQDHVQQQLATIIKHTHVAAHWPQVPVAMATGRAAGSVATSISDISSHHLIASGGALSINCTSWMPLTLILFLGLGRL